ncbi:MAG: hypothetical protein HYU80_04075 [Candidatus Blackburnbacteria bacterium]|nr:hypothetical protein [Candidatus Blackburnbacteria bacterium]
MLNPLVVFTASLVDSINPCAISVLFLTIGFLFSLQKTRKEILQAGFGYILGIFIIYILIGLGLLRALSFFGVPHFLAKIGASIVIGAGTLNLLDSIFPNFPIKFKIPQFAHPKIAQLIQKNSFPAALSLGFVVGMYEFPCTGGPYLMILGLLHDQATFWSGLLYLIFYNVVFVLPLVAVLLIASNPILLEKVKVWRKRNSPLLKYSSSLGMIILGIVILLTS